MATPIVLPVFVGCERPMMEDSRKIKRVMAFFFISVFGASGLWHGVADFCPSKQRYIILGE